MEIYGKCIQPAVSDDTRWNSYFNCCKSLNVTKNALRSLATKFEPPTSTTRRRPTDPLTIPHEIYNIIMNGSFWKSLTKFEQLLIPYCAILNILQTDKACLFEVLHGFAYLYQFWQKYPNTWTGKEPTSILKEFDEFSQEIKYPFDDASVAQFENGIHKYWCWVRNTYPEIGTVAAHIFGICVNAASVERLWSSMGFFHTKTRNRLKETEPDNNNNKNNENEESDEDMDDEEFNIEEEFQNQIEQFLEIDSNINNDDFDLDNIDVEGIEHPAQNKDAKWKLDIIFEDNLHCPF
ncbi:hypothetical protein RhiirA1_398538 [Rhizophagus irregularis]|uniref:HAT C-terminal dimerisation domain-containing protein n=1 Tax=Rhizophagus irregularis TaxID=588596 RepID=A0A2N0RD94_9GLOM|nr:hypothetical protein RhiirA1_398538 [Rhizophagus irregularis]